MINFLFVLFLIGVFIASIQDLRKREVDNYINFFLLVSGAVFLIFYSIFSWNYWVLVFAAASFAIMFILGNAFYYGRVFAGGDSKLMIAMFSLFVAASLKETILNIGFFILFLMIAGSIYGIFYSGYLVSRNFKSFKNEAWKEMRNGLFKSFMFLGLFLALSSYFYPFLLVMAIFCWIFLFLFISGKAIEKTCLINKIPASKAREGDWIVYPVKIGSRTIKPDWEGLTKKDLVLLKKFKGKITVKDGLPFVPAFFIGLIIWFFRMQILEFFINLV